jgi:hypothetical protein
MIAWFTKDGVPNPVRFRIEKENELLRVIKIDKIINKEIEKLAGNNTIVFKCQSTINEIDTTYEIKYELNTCRWILFKI